MTVLVNRRENSEWNPLQFRLATLLGLVLLAAVLFALLRQTPDVAALGLSHITLLTFVGTTICLVKMKTAKRQACFGMSLGIGITMLLHLWKPGWFGAVGLAMRSLRAIMGVTTRGESELAALLSIVASVDALFLGALGGLWGMLIWFVLDRDGARAGSQD